MTNPIFYNRVVTSTVQGDGYNVILPNGTLVVANGGELRLHNGSTAGGNAISGGGGSIGSFGTDAGIGSGYNTNNPAILFSDDDMIIRTGGTAGHGTIGAMYIASAEELIIGHSDSSLTDATSLSTASYTNYLYFDGSGIEMHTARGTVQFGYNLEAPGMPTHFHINKVDQSFDLFFGDDANYLQLPVGGGSPTIGASGGNGQKLYVFGQNGILTIPGEIDSAAGTGAVTVNSYDGATTRTWTFGTDGNLVVPGAIQSTNGIVISNAGVVGATAGIVLPANAGTGAVQIGNTYGPIQLGSAVGGGTELTWTFDTTGILTVPITASGAGQISGGTNGLQLVSNSNTWGFGTDASLTVPGIITLPNGQGQIGNGGAGIDIICNVNSYGYITLNYLSQASVSVNTSGIVLTSNSSSWTFNSGSIQFPDATNQLTAFELQGVSQSPWGTTYPSSGGIANLDYQFYFDPGTGHPTIQSYAGAGGNPLYNTIWSYDAWLAASSSANPIAGSSGATPIQVNNTGGSVILSSVLQPGDYVTVRIQCIDTGRIFRATFMGAVNPNDFGITYGAITVERLL